MARHLFIYIKQKHYIINTKKGNSSLTKTSDQSKTGQVSYEYSLKFHNYEMSNRYDRKNRRNLP